MERNKVVLSAYGTYSYFRGGAVREKGGVVNQKGGVVNNAQKSQPLPSFYSAIVLVSAEGLRKTTKWVMQRGILKSMSFRLPDNRWRGSMERWSFHYAVPL
jgi:hypothetical protein